MKCMKNSSLKYKHDKVAVARSSMSNKDIIQLDHILNNFFLTVLMRVTL
jgi:hypothetical protein